MTSNRQKGDRGEKEVIDLVPCPNCGKALIQLPENYPLYDIQCSGCSFRAQVKTNNARPSDVIFGAGWEILHKVTKAGFMVPALITLFRWRQSGKIRRTILFYPFVPKGHLEKRQLSPTARRANYKMFNYTGLKHLPHFILYDDDSNKASHRPASPRRARRQ